jgi:hypothetical protein
VPAIERTCIFWSGECSTWNGGPGRVVEGSMDNVCHKNDGFINGERKKHKVKEVEERGRTPFKNDTNK